mmetsp:Transcript_69737/g.145729  ORF Transcript_69737/g.145729 Transcript_69737/m.145729 type:complete len:765 (+) Transcript_69737:113-2407(+)
MAVQAPVVFLNECKYTQPGETVYVLGGHQALGQWDPKKALPMSTNASTFPLWTSASVNLPVGQPIEYKCLILRGDKSVVKWEAFAGNRTVEPVADSVMSIRSTWDNVKTTSSTTPLASDHIPPPGTVKEGGTLNRTVSGAAIFGDQMGRLVETLESKEPMRRNFSQSLLCLEAPAAHQENSQESGPETTATSPSTEVRQQALSDDDDPYADVQGLPKTHAATRGVSLQNVSSFTALTEMLPAVTKTEGRHRRKAEYEPFNLNVPVVIVTSEVAPYSKSGGLGLVAASYSYEFARNGHRTMTISPKYQHYEGIQYVGETRVRVGGQDQLVKFWHKFQDIGDGKGCDWVFVDHPSIERGGGLYNGDDGREYGDNLLRFSLLSAAALEAPLILHVGGFPYGDKVVFVANDWQAGLVPVYLSYKYRRHNCYSQARCLYVIHNMGYQGQYHSVNACDFFNIDHQAAGDILLGNCINLTKGAVICCDRVLTVSPNYAWEIQTREGGFGLDEYVRGKANSLRLSGILNGIDDCWNPAIDTKIARNFCERDFLEGKKFNKTELQRRLGLRQDPSAIVLGFIGRLTWQKGVDVLADCIGWLMEDTGNGVTGRAQLIMMGNGEERYANALRWAEGTFQGRVCGYVGFDPKVEHQMMAGCDLFIMPSRYEPCGLPQMYAQAYGTLPVVHATGGLKDSVRDISEGLNVATGFHVSYMTTDKVKAVLWKAMEMYFKAPRDFQKMQENAMSCDYYWPQAMDQYEQNIDYTLYDPPNTR